jgi:hypothetical protein
MYGDLRVRVDGNRLVVDLGPNGAGGTLEHWQYDAFQLVWRDRAFGRSDLTFSLNRDGQPTTVRIESGQDPMVFRRRPQENP